jgi:hypothetical protein
LATPPTVRQPLLAPTMASGRLPLPLHSSMPDAVPPNASAGLAESLAVAGKQPAVAAPSPVLPREPAPSAPRRHSVPPEAELPWLHVSLWRPEPDARLPEPGQPTLDRFFVVLP